MGNIIPKQRSGVAKSHLRYVHGWFSTPILTNFKYYMEIGSAKVYFNARFDDVMLIVKREMASVLGGPLQATYYNSAMYVFSTLSDRRINTGTTRNGKFGNDIGHIVIGHA